jgi:hypothetical protein
MEKIKVGVLGATGAVGQRFVQMLQGHPWFEITALFASERSAGKRYVDACRWNLRGDMPDAVRSLIVQECEPGPDCQIVFSALPSETAGEIEEDFAEAGYVVCSNARNHRYDADVPLLIPEVNPEHLGLIEIQKRNRGWSGYITTNPNCSTTHLVSALHPLHVRFGIKKVFVVTMQAISGAGYPGVSSMDILDNVIPYISGEEEKMEQKEPQKLLGLFDGTGIQRRRRSSRRGATIARWHSNCNCRAPHSPPSFMTNGKIARSRVSTAWRAACQAWRPSSAGCAPTRSSTPNSWRLVTTRFAGRRGAACSTPSCWWRRATSDKPLHFWQKAPLLRKIW